MVVRRVIESLIGTGIWILCAGVIGMLGFGVFVPMVMGIWLSNMLRLAKPIGVPNVCEGSE